MKLYERLPEKVRVNGKTVKCDFDFRNVLRMLETLARDDLTEEARAYIAVKCVAKRVKVNPSDFLNSVYPLLFSEKKSTDDQTKLTDFDQDADYIRAAFLQAYGINLYHRAVVCFFDYVKVGVNTLFTLCAVGADPAGLRFTLAHNSGSYFFCGKKA